jgi:uncharacterized lipoprotein YmbA
MMPLRYYLNTFMLACWLVVTLSGCARSPQVNFYTLDPLVVADAVVTPPPFSIAVGPLTLPDVIDRPQLVLTTSSSRVSILEMHHWAEPLKRAIPRLLADNLSRLLGSDRVASYPQSASNEADYRIIVDVLRFESSDNSVTLETLCTIRTATDGPAKIRRFKMNEKIRGNGNDERVAAYSRALAALSKDLAALLRGTQTDPGR